MILCRVTMNFLLQGIKSPTQHNHFILLISLIQRMFLNGIFPSAMILFFGLRSIPYGGHHRLLTHWVCWSIYFFQEEDGIRDMEPSIYPMSITSGMRLL